MGASNNPLRDEVRAAVGRLAVARRVDPVEVNTELVRGGHPARAECTQADLRRILAQLTESAGEYQDRLLVRHIAHTGSASERAVRVLARVADRDNRKVA